MVRGDAIERSVVVPGFEIELSISIPDRHGESGADITAENTRGMGFLHLIGGDFRADAAAS